MVHDTRRDLTMSRLLASAPHSPRAEHGPEDAGRGVQRPRPVRLDAPPGAPHRRRVRREGARHGPHEPLGAGRAARGAHRRAEAAGDQLAVPVRRGGVSGPARGLAVCTTSVRMFRGLLLPAPRGGQTRREGTDGWRNGDAGRVAQQVGFEACWARRGERRKREHAAAPDRAASRRHLLECLGWQQQNTAGRSRISFAIWTISLRATRRPPRRRCKAATSPFAPEISTLFGNPAGSSKDRRPEERALTRRPSTRLCAAAMAHAGGGEKLLSEAGGPSTLIDAASALPLWLPIVLCVVLTWASALSNTKHVLRATSSALELVERGLRSYLGATVSVWLGTKLLRKLYRALRRRRAARSSRRGRSYGSTGALDGLANDPQLPLARDLGMETSLPGCAPPPRQAQRVLRARAEIPKRPHLTGFRQR